MHRADSTLQSYCLKTMGIDCYQTVENTADHFPSTQGAAEMELIEGDCQTASHWVLVSSDQPQVIELLLKILAAIHMPVNQRAIFKVNGKKPVFSFLGRGCKLV